MKAIVLTKFGPPEVLQLQEIAQPAPSDQEVLIKIYATTVTAGDCQLRSLKLPLAYRLPILIGASVLRRIRPTPFILGQEIAGEIEAVGKDVQRFSKGDQVFAWTGIGLGGYAEYTCLPEKGVMAIKPPQLTYD
jgi:NADPH:quinone reductase-like Zn-dependent oxidoreductase